MMKITKPNKTAMAAAIEILARRSYSVKMLSDKLQLKGYESDEISQVIERLIERGYVNDQDLCQYLYRNYIEAEHYSRRQIEAKLQQKGFAKQSINECRQESDSENEMRAAAKLLRQKYNPDKIVPTVKLMQYLYSKGFTNTSIKKAVTEFTNQLPPEDFY